MGLKWQASSHIILLYDHNQFKVFNIVAIYDRSDDRFSQKAREKPVRKTSRLKVVRLEEALVAGTSAIKAASFASGRFESWSQPGVLGDGQGGQGSKLGHKYALKN